jgi:ketosteroid isomerase-like protein
MIHCNTTHPLLKKGEIMKTFEISFLLITIFVFIACTAEDKVDTKADVEAIRTVSMAVVTTWNEGDYDGFMTYIDDEAILLPQNAPTVKGIEAISSLYSNSFKNFSLEVENSIEEIQVYGDYACELGTWIGSMNPKDGSTPIDFNNKVLCIYKRQTNSLWKMYRLMYSSNEAPEKLHIPEIPET